MRAAFPGDPKGRPASAAPARPAFSVVEILIVVVVLTLISLIVIPLLLDSLEVGKQKRTMADMSQVGQAMMAWVQDRVSAAAATFPIAEHGSPIEFRDLEDLLVPSTCPRCRSSTPGEDDSSIA